MFMNNGVVSDADVTLEYGLTFSNVPRMTAPSWMLTRSPTEMVATSLERRQRTTLL